MFGILRVKANIVHTEKNVKTSRGVLTTKKVMIAQN